MLVEEFITANVSPYAILSHTWEEEEVSFQDIQTETAKGKKGYSKIEMTCKMAAAEGLAYAWVDTCCIDKSSSAELTEAINSMFKWYRDAAKCYVYLSDLWFQADLESHLRNCRWFSRGWTLQELIAPSDVSFFDHDWTHRGFKTNLLLVISRITSIELAILDHTAPLSSVPVARRMSWAAHRQTTREEDSTYCLLGLFDVNMPLLYGEGSKAFLRLQEEIIKSTCDLSIFAWRVEPDQNEEPRPRYSGTLAESPKAFQGSGSITKTEMVNFDSDFSVTNRGIRMHTSLNAEPIVGSQGWLYVLDLDCRDGDDERLRLAIRLKICGPNLYVRCDPGLFSTLTPRLPGLMYVARDNTIYISSKLPETTSPLNQRSALTWRESNLIIGKRIAAVKINVSSAGGALQVTELHAHPISHFDSEECVFFSTNEASTNVASHSWCALIVQGVVQLPTFRDEVVFMILCKDWDDGRKDLECSFVNPAGCDIHRLSQFLSELEQKQHSLLSSTWGDLEDFGISTADSITIHNYAGSITI